MSGLSFFFLFFSDLLFFGRFGKLLALWAVVGNRGAIVGSRGQSWGNRGQSWGNQGQSWAIVGQSWVIVGNRGQSWAVVGQPWATVGQSWAFMGNRGASKTHRMAKKNKNLKTTIKTDRPNKKGKIGVQNRPSGKNNKTPVRKLSKTPSADKNH